MISLTNAVQHLLRQTVDAPQLGATEHHKEMVVALPPGRMAQELSIPTMAAEPPTDKEIVHQLGNLAPRPLPTALQTIVSPPALRLQPTVAAATPGALKPPPTSHHSNPQTTTTAGASRATIGDRAPMMHRLPEHPCRPLLLAQ